LLLVVSESNRNVIYWLIHLLAEVAEHSGVNKMNERNLAIVVGPTLRDVSIDDPLVGLEQTQQVCAILGRMIESFINAKKAQVIMDEDDDLKIGLESSLLDNVVGKTSNDVKTIQSADKISSEQAEISSWGGKVPSKPKPLEILKEKESKLTLGKERKHKR